MERWSEWKEVIANRIIFNKLGYKTAEEGSVVSQKEIVKKFSSTRRIRNGERKYILLYLGKKNKNDGIN